MVVYIVVDLFLQLAFVWSAGTFSWRVASCPHDAFFSSGPSCSHKCPESDVFLSLQKFQVSLGGSTNDKYIMVGRIIWLMMVSLNFTATVLHKESSGYSELLTSFTLFCTLLLCLSWVSTNRYFLLSFFVLSSWHDSYLRLWVSVTWYLKKSQFLMSSITIYEVKSCFYIFKDMHDWDANPI